MGRKFASHKSQRTGDAENGHGALCNAFRSHWQAQYESLLGILAGNTIYCIQTFKFTSTQGLHCDQRLSYNIHGKRPQELCIIMIFECRVTIVCYFILVSLLLKLLQSVPTGLLIPLITGIHNLGQ